jgi:hypothetical protein
MDTQTSILVTQIPIAVAILIGAHQMYLLRKDLVEILRILAKR